MIRGISLYWKTWLITVCTLLLTLAGFFIVLTFSITSFIESSQTKKFEQNVKVITENFTDHGIDEEQLTNFMVQGYYITISQGAKTVFPPWVGTFGVLMDGSASIQVPSETATSIGAVTPASPVVPSDTVVTREVLSTEGVLATKVLEKEQKLTYQNKEYVVRISYPVGLNKEDVNSVFVEILPYFLLIGVVISSVVSAIYASYFASKIKRLNSKIKLMAARAIPANRQPKKGDELQKLENNLDEMYAELLTTLDKLNQEMLVVKRLETDRQVFMRGATHELKTPIMAMSTMLEGMITGVQGYENHADYLNACYQRLQSMTKLVNEMLEVSRLESVKSTGETDLNEVTQEVIEIYQYMLEDKELQLTLSLDGHAQIAIPKKNLQKVLSNLIGNAVKYTPEKGTLRVSSTGTSWLIENQMETDNQVDEQKIFEPFVSYDQSQGNSFENGHGLGLYIVDAILKQYGYTYSCEIDAEKQHFRFKILNQLT